MAVIISKLLDTTYELYVLNLISLLEIFISKTPEYFIKYFISEGIIEKLKNYEVDQKISESLKAKNKKNEKKESFHIEKDNDSYSNILDKDNNINEYSDGYYDSDNDDNQNDENDSEKQNESGNEDKIISLDFNSSKNSNNIDKNIEKNKNESTKEDKHK